MREINKKYEYECQYCSKKYLAYPSQRRGKTHACSKKCAAELRKITQIGENNPNFKHGDHCTDSLCACGKVKDYRAIKCSSCTRLHKPVEGFTRDTDGMIKAVKHANSFVEAAKLCGEYRSKIKEVVEEFNLDISHFVVCRDRPSTELDIFKIHDKRVNPKVRRYLIENEIIEYKCSICDLEDSWQGDNITLELDHINGDCCDNRLENLRFLCPNCHSQTDTFRGRNINGPHKERN